jgi:hypothetical protein
MIDLEAKVSLMSFMLMGHPIRCFGEGFERINLFTHLKRTGCKQKDRIRLSTFIIRSNSTATNKKMETKKMKSLWVLITGGHYPIPQYAEVPPNIEVKRIILYIPAALSS